MKTSHKWFLLNSGGGAPYSTEAQDVFNRMSGLTDTEKDLMAAFIDSQVTSGNWAKMGCYQDYEVQLFSNARLDWLGNFNGEASLITGITHTPGQGLTFSGSQARGFDTGHDVSLDGKIAINNALVGGYSKENLSTVDQKRFIWGGGGNLELYQRTVASRLDMRISNLVTQVAGYASGFLSNKHYTSRQLNAGTSVSRAYEEATLKNTGTSATVTIGSGKTYVGGRGDSEGAWVGTIGAFYTASESGFDLADFITNRNIMIAGFFLI